MEDLFIAGWGTYKTGKGGWLYVVLSRVKDLKNIYILEELKTDITKYVARTYEVNEDRRLELLAKKWLSDLVLNLKYDIRISQNRDYS